MVLNKFIPVHEAPPEIRNYPLFQLYMYCDAAIEGKYNKVDIFLNETILSLF